MRIKKSGLQPPFRQQDLLTVSSFIRYCKERGIYTDENQLEYYERLGLLFPAIRVNPGIIKYKRVFANFDGKDEWRFTPKGYNKSELKPKKVDKKIYYDYGGLSIGKPGWLGWYLERKRVRYPIKVGFKPWSEYDGNASTTSWPSNKRLTPKYVVLYAKHQVFALKRVQSELSINIRDETLFQSDTKWIKTGKKIRDFFANAPKLIRAKIFGLYEILRLIDGVYELREEMTNESINLYLKTYQDLLFKGNSKIEAENEALLDAEHSLTFQQKNVIPTKAKALFEKYNLSKTQIADWRNQFITWGYFLDPTIQWFEYVENIPGKLLEKSKGDYKFALECYRKANILGWFLEMLGEQVPSLKKSLTGIDKYKVCTECKRYYIPKTAKKTQKTCGRKKCVGANKNKWKREMRKMGLLD